jgi:Protein of unknown function (DUF1638)
MTPNYSTCFEEVLRPGDDTRSSKERGIVVIACGALAKEILTLIKLNSWEGLELQCIPAQIHNTPHKIPDAVEQKIIEAKAEGKGIFVAFADCGTGGMLDKVLERHNVERLPGAHCYEFFATSQVFLELTEREIGTFFLTDFLVRSFDHLVIKGLGLERYPELLPTYFGNYKRLVYLAQFRDEALLGKAQKAAQRLGLEFEYRYTGFGDLQTSIAMQVHP